MNITYNNKPFDELTPDQLRDIEINHVDSLLLGYHEMVFTRLCDPAGQAIVAEYGFAGNLIDVLTQLEEYREMLKDAEFSDEFIAEIKSRKEKLVLFDAAREKVNGHAEIETAVKTYDMNKIIEAYLTAAKKNKEVAEMMHENHECLCYTNIREDDEN